MEAPEVMITVTADRPLRAAQELLSRAHLLDPKAASPPVDVDHLAEMVGTRVIPWELPDEISGFLVELDDGPVIGTNKRHSPSRRRFSVAHELGHQLLHHHDRFHVDLTSESDSPLYDWRLEREANDFAANLLMPAGDVRDAVDTQRNRQRLAEVFGVSPIAMSYRLVNLGLR